MKTVAIFKNQKNRALAKFWYNNCKATKHISSTVQTDIYIMPEETYELLKKTRVIHYTV